MDRFLDTGTSSCVNVLALNVKVVKTIKLAYNQDGCPVLAEDWSRDQHVGCGRLFNPDGSNGCYHAVLRDAASTSKLVEILDILSKA